MSDAQILNMDALPTVGNPGLCKTAIAYHTMKPDNQ